MRREPEANPDQIDYRQPAGAGAVGHVIFIVAHLCVTAVVTRSVLTQPAAKDTGVMLLMLVVPLLLLAGLVTYVRRYVIRIGTTIDRKAGTVATRWGPLALLFGKTWPLSDFDHLRIGGITMQSGSRISGFKTILTLAGPTGEILIGVDDDYANIGDMAEEVALFLNFDVLDHTVTPERWLRVASLRSGRLEAASAPQGTMHDYGMPDRPAGGVVTRRIENDRIVFEFPREGESGCLAVWICLAIGIAAFVTWYIIDWRGWTVMGGVLVATFVGVFMLMLFADSAAPVTVTLIATDKDLTIERNRWYGTHRQRFPKSRIHDLKRVQDRLVVDAEGRSNVMWHGKIGEEEMEWIRLQLGCVLGK